VRLPARPVRRHAPPAAPEASGALSGRAPHQPNHPIARHERALGAARVACAWSSLASRRR
jgi:hypothetical protein